MLKKIILWVIAILISAGSMVYQRLTGPTYPLKGKVMLGNSEIKYDLPRSHPGETDCPIKISIGDKNLNGKIIWKRFKVEEDYAMSSMEYKDGQLIGYLPYQPPAGKLEYKIELKDEKNAILLPTGNSVVIRFRGDVPAYVIIPHIIFMIIAMLLSTRTGLEYFNSEPKFKKLALYTIIALFIGGFILGPIVQKFSFGAFWTGFPFGYDLTDNKTAIAFIAWLVAYYSIFKFKNPKRWIMGAAIITLLVFMIPHSVLGSELDYSKIKNNKIEQMK